MVEHVEIVVCRHPNYKGDFIFRAPEDSGKKLCIGDWVLVDTKQGPNQIAQCITPQFMIADFQLKQFYNVDVEKLRPVTAYMKPVCFVFTPAKE